MGWKYDEKRRAFREAKSAPRWLAVICLIALAVGFSQVARVVDGFQSAPLYINGECY